MVIKGMAMLHRCEFLLRSIGAGIVALGGAHSAGSATDPVRDLLKKSWARREGRRHDCRRCRRSRHTIGHAWKLRHPGRRSCCLRVVYTVCRQRALIGILWRADSLADIPVRKHRQHESLMPDLSRLHGIANGGRCGQFSINRDLEGRKCLFKRL